MISFFPNDQTFVLFRIGSLTLDIRWYAVLILAGASLAYYFCRKGAKESRYIDAEFFDSLFIYTLWAGIIGARLWFCTFYNFGYYIANPLEIIRIWDGGLAIQGGLVFGALFAWLYCRRYRYPFMKIVDICLPNVLLAQAIGRWGNFVNRECHGGEVSESYFDGILSFLKEGMYINGHYYEPLFFFESVLCIFGWVMIYVVLRKRQNKRGDLAYAYLMWYGLIRFFIEGRRTDSLYLGNLKMAQLTSLVFLVVGVLGYLGLLQRFTKQAKPTLLFDFDGTLMDTRASITAGYEELFRRYRKPEDFTEEIRQEIIGPALKELFPIYFPDVPYEELYSIYKQRQKEVASTANKVTEHSYEVLKTLHEEGYDIGIISTRFHDDIIGLSKSGDLYDFIDDECGVDDVKKSKPDPEGVFKLVNENRWNREVVLIGDSLMDIDCGLNYGAFTVAYVSDPKRHDELKAKASRTITDMADLMKILKEDTSFTYNER